MPSRSSCPRKPASSRSLSTARSSVGSIPTRLRARLQSLLLQRRVLAPRRNAPRAGNGRSRLTMARDLALPARRVEAVVRGARRLLWMVIAGEETVERGLRVPLELQQFPSGLELLGDVPTTADVRVRGRVRHAQPLSPGRHRRGARPARRAAGERLFHLTPEQVRAPFGVEVVQVTPPTVAVVFETAASRTVADQAGHRGQAGGRLRGRQDRRGSAERRSRGSRKRRPPRHRSADRTGVGRPARSGVSRRP